MEETNTDPRILYLREQNRNLWDTLGSYTALIDDSEETLNWDISDERWRDLLAHKMKELERLRAESTLQREQFATERDRNICLTAVRIVAALDELRGDDGDSVEVPNDNPDFGGPNNCITVRWGWEHEARVCAASLLDCLEKAVALRRVRKAGE